MPFNIIDQANTHIFGFSVSGKLTSEDVQSITTHLEAAIKLAKKKLRLFVQATEMENAELKSQWEIFSFLKHHVMDLELIAIVGAHGWEKTMSEVLSSSIFVLADTRYFEKDEAEGAMQWLRTAEHPSHIPERRVIDSSKGLFTKHGSPNFM
jgi:DNA topoisomerase VI subunit B